VDAEKVSSDPITVQIVRGALRAVQSEMEALIERTAMSPFIREKKDFYAALFDADGRLIVGSNLPLFGDVIGPIAEHYPLETMREGRHLLVQRLLRLARRGLAHSGPSVRHARFRRRQAFGVRAVVGAF
jgi:hypothetical protein